jgi:hypothetical protein
VPKASGSQYNSLGLALPGSIVGSYVASVGISGGVINAHYSNQTVGTQTFKANNKINNATLQFSPITQVGSMVWTCRKSTTGTDLQLKWLPASCRPQ